MISHHRYERLIRRMYEAPGNFRAASMLNVTVDHAALFEVTLVVLLGFPESGDGEDLGSDGLAVSAGGVELGDASMCLSELLSRMGEDDAAVLSSEIRTLVVDLSGVVHGEKGVEERVVGEA